MIVEGEMDSCVGSQRVVNPLMPPPPSTLHLPYHIPSFTA